MSLSMTDDAWVRHTQVEMKRLGLYKGVIDGSAGPGTQDGFSRMAALASGLLEVTTPLTTAPSPLVRVSGSRLKLDDIDLPRIGSLIQVGEDEIHAVLDVEARGSGWDDKGRIVMLFEPHVFYRVLGPGPMRDEAVKEGLAYRSWGERRYPRDSYPTFWRACAIDAEAACRAASWGLGQVLGENAESLGFPSATAMVEALADDEEAHLRSMVAFIQANRLDDELRGHNWRAFARGYNGPAYAKHGYHIRLEARYLWWSRKPDTIWDPRTHPAGILGQWNPLDQELDQA